MSPQHLHKLAGVNHFHASHIPQFEGYIEPTCFVYKSLKSCSTLGKQSRSIRISSGFRKDSSRSSISKGRKISLPCENRGGFRPKI